AAGSFPFTRVENLDEVIGGDRALFVPESLQHGITRELIAQTVALRRPKKNDFAAGGRARDGRSFFRKGAGPERTLGGHVYSGQLEVPASALVPVITFCPQEDVTEKRDLVVFFHRPGFRLQGDWAEGAHFAICFFEPGKLNEESRVRCVENVEK